MPMTLSGDGTITGLAVGGLPNATVVQADLATGVAGTGPAFSAYAGAATSVANATWTKIAFNTEEFDTNSNYDTSTSRFTPTVAGYYQVNATLGFGGMTSGGAFLSIYKNGSSFKYGNLYTASAVGILSTVNTLVYLNGTTDYLEIYGYQGSGTSKNTTSGSVIDAYFQASMVRAA